MPFPPHPPWFNHPSMLWGCKPWLSLCNFLQSLVTPSLFGPNIFLSLLFSNILQLHSYFNVSDWILHALKTRKITLNSYTSWTYCVIHTSIRTTGKVQKVFKFKYHTPSSKPYRTGKIHFCLLFIFMFCNWKLETKSMDCMAAGIPWIYCISWPIRRTVIFSLEILEKNNDECILILVICWKKTGLLHTKISNHNIIYSSQKPRKSLSLPLKSPSWLFSLDAFKYGNNTYPRRIRHRSNLGHIFREKRCVLWAGKCSNQLLTHACIWIASSIMNEPIWPILIPHENLL